MRYKHTQIGYLLIVILLILTTYFFYILKKVDYDPLLFAIIILILFLIISFSWLTVSIDQIYLGITFGYGIFRKKFQLKKITSVKVVKNHWYYGWGIKYWWWPRMWILNVSGLDAVEIVLKDGRCYRIGTDEPKRLEFAILEAMK